ncbi:MAG: PAS domain S-box protein [Dehalococcoidia bacterium]|nr:MAG: PAS domain S-box protein [Dehalococcoidia bacterium]
MDIIPEFQDEIFRVIVEDAPDGILLVDLAGRVVFANRQVTELFGYASEEIHGQRVEILIPENKRAMHIIHREIYQEHPETRPMGSGLDLAGRRRDGSTFPVEISLSLLSTGEGDLAVAVVRDVSRQRRGEEALRRSEERHRLLTEHAQDVIFRYRLLPTPGFEYVSAAMTRLLGYRVEEFYVDDQLIFRVVHPDDRPLLERAFTADGPRTFALRLQHRDGALRWFEQSMSPVIDAQGVTVALEGIARDVTDRRVADEERNLLLSEVERQMERERIAGDLHDETIQSIYAVGLGLHAALADPSVTKEAALEHTIEDLNSVIVELRTYMQGLSGQAVGGGLEPLAIRVEALVRGGVLPRWTLAVAPDLALDPAFERHVYLLAKELISNVQRHAHAETASLTIAREGIGSEGRLLIRITDDGVGFERDGVPPTSFGFRSMEQRVALLDGSMVVKSRPGTGTAIEIALPLTASETGTR